MGHNRFICSRYPIEMYSRRRKFLYLNEEGTRPHLIHAYGLAHGKFAYRSIFQRKDYVTDRSAKRSVRQNARQELQKEALSCYEDSSALKKETSIRPVQSSSRASPLKSKESPHDGAA